MFRVGDKIVHPMHGAGVVEDIVENKVNGVVREYYVMKLPVRSMVVMIPVHNCAEIGVRAVVDVDQAEQIIASLPAVQVDVEQNWNRRYRENMDRLKSGNLTEVARVIKGLMLRDTERRLPTGERQMLRSARERLGSELGLALGDTFENIEQRINQGLV